MIAPAADALVQRGLARHEAGALADARACYEQALAQDPSDTRALHLLGVVLRDTGDPAGGLALIDRALAIDARNAVFHHNRGLALRLLGDHGAAVEAFRSATRLDPRLAASHMALGNALRALGNLDEACAAEENAIALEPGSAEAWSNLGLTHRDARRFDEAVRAFGRAVALAPRNADVQHNLGSTLLYANRLEDAERALRAALSLDARHARAGSDLGIVLKEQGRVTEAIAELRAVVAADPANADAQWNLALTLLLAGEFAEGWRLYEWRRAIASIPIRRFPHATPAWAGEPLSGRTLLIHAEQGLGDVVQFARFVPLLRADHRTTGSRVFFLVPRKLRELLAGLAGSHDLVPDDSAIPTFDVHAPLMSLPFLLGPETTRLDGSEAYIRPDPTHIDPLRTLLDPDARLHVGIAWQGNPSYGADARRSIPLEHFLDLARDPGVRLYSLQKGHGAEQLPAAVGSHAVRNVASLLDNGPDAFVDTAAFTRCLDLVICSDSAITHVAGAVGANVWLALARVPDWRWGLTGTRTPWYPTMRCFRQPQAGDWPAVFADIARALECARVDRLVGQVL